MKQDVVINIGKKIEAIKKEVSKALEVRGNNDVFLINIDNALLDLENYLQNQINR